MKVPAVARITELFLPMEYSPTRYSFTSDLFPLCTVSRALNRGLHPDWICVEHTSTSSPMEVTTCTGKAEVVN